MKNLKKILSVLTLIVLVGSDFLTSISYALDDLLEDSVVVQAENEEAESVENEEENVDEKDSEDAYEGESIGEENEAGETVESTTGDIVEEGIGEVSEIGSGEVEELTEETVESATLDIVESVTGDVEEITGMVDENTGTGEETIIEEIKYNEEPIIGEKTYNDVTVKVEALSGIFPEGTELKIEPIKGGDLSSLKDKLVEEKEEIKEDTTVVAFDITFKYEGEEIQPKDGEKVKVTFDYSMNKDLVKADKNKNQEIKVYHMEDKDEEGNKVVQGEEKVVDVTNKQESAEKGIAVADADSFSVYVVTYGNEDPEFSVPLVGEDSARNNFHYKTITISDGENTYTLMDRNLGARVAWNTGTYAFNDKSNYNTEDDYYGYYYQWGNNYGFSNTQKYGNVISDAIPSNYVSSSWSTSNLGGYNLRGDTTNTESARQGPCPRGWHVPSANEWEAIKKAWCISYNNTENCQGVGRQFAEALQMPTAGYRYYNYGKFIYSSSGSNGYYWSSTSNDNSKANYLFFRSSNVNINTDDRVNGLQVRCLKNNTDAVTLYLNPNGGRVEDAIIDADEQGKVILPTATRNEYNFDGWYDAVDGGNRRGGSGDEITINEDTDLYAHWSEIIPNPIVIFNNGADITEFEVESGGMLTNEQIQQILNLTHTKATFDGWYKDLEFTHPFDFNTIITEDTALYAKWTCKPGYTTLQGNGGPDMNCFEYETISYEDTDGNEHVLMDRNLGAQMIGFLYDADSKSYGYYYQWGNNYGFSSFTTPITSNTQIDCTNINPSTYSSSTLVVGSDDLDWCSSRNNNLWGGENDNENNGRGMDLNNLMDRQGPCPNGWHVPSIGERQTLLTYWASLNNVTLKSRTPFDYYVPSYNGDYVNYNEFKAEFKIPIAGQFQYLNHGGGGLATLWSSSFDEDMLARDFRLSMNGKEITANGRSYRDIGESVRCFMNNPKTVTFNYNGGEGEDFERIIPSGTKVTAPADPTNEDKIFAGWYVSTDGGTTLANTAFDFNEEITQDVDLYAKWVSCENGEIYAPESGECVARWHELVSLTNDNTTTTVGSDEPVEGLPTTITVTENDILESSEGEELSEVEGKELAGDITIDFGGDAKFSRLVQVNIPVTGSSKAYVKVKHVGSTGYNYDGLTRNINASCDSGNIENPDDMYDGTYIDVESGYVSIYTCRASDFAAFGLPKVTFEPENESGAIVVEVESGAMVNNEDIPTVTKDGYNFSGWYLTGAESAFDFSGTAITGNITLYARWEQEGESVTYTVTFDANRGTFANLPDSQTVASGSLISVPTQQQTPELPGYAFTGWWTEPRGGTQWDFTNDIVTGNITLYAHWTYEEIFGDLDVYMIDSGGSLIKYVIMDRNMGATGTYNKDFDNQNHNSFGFVYQWGNNYGFPRCNSNVACNYSPITDTPVSVDIVENYIPSKFASSTWIGRNGGNGSSKSRHLNSGNVLKYLWGNTNVTDMQGPCPDGYHVPLASETNGEGGLFRVWGNIYDKTINTIVGKGEGFSFLSDDQELFSSQFLFPHAGNHKKGNTREQEQNMCGDYWTATPSGLENATNMWFCKDGDNKFYDDDNGNFLFTNSSQRNNGSTLRCFKNSTSSANLDIVNGGKKGLITVDKVDGVATINAIKEPENTDVNGRDLIFDGWYTSQNFEPSTMKTGGDILSDAVTALYAKWDCPDGLVYNSNNECISGVLVRFMDGETEYTRSVVLSGEEVRAPATNPKKAGHIFTGWFEFGAELPFVFTGTPITGNLDLYAHWEELPETEALIIVNYYLKNLDVENNVLTGGVIVYSTGVEFIGEIGDTLNISGTYLTGIVGYYYDHATVFSGEDEILEDEIYLDGNKEVNMYYIPEQNQFTLNTVLYSNTDGSSENGMYYYGAKVILSGASSDDRYLWSGWIGLPEGTPNSAQTEFYMPNSAVTVTSSVKEKTYDVYTVTFKNRNGDFLWSGKVASGTTPVYTGTRPSRPSTEQVVYSFNGWYPELSPVTGDITYTALYTEAPRLYTVILTGTPAGYGTLSTGSLSKEYGAAIVISGDKLTVGGTEVILTGNEGYEFQEWTGNCGYVERPICNENVIYTHPGVIEFTGSNNLIIRNLGYDLFSEANFHKDFEISFNILNLDLKNSVNQATLISVKNEDLQDIWPGFTVRRGSATNYQITANGGIQSAVTVNRPAAGVNSLKIKRENNILYISENDGEDIQIYNYTGFSDSYYFDNPIAIGSIYKGQTGQRYIKATLSDIVIKSMDSSCTSGLVLAVTGDCQMTAVFQELEERNTVRFIDGESVYATDTVLSGSEVTPPVDPEKSGYNFVGWFAEGAESTFVFSGTPITGDLDLYAQWSIKNYEVDVSVATGDEGYLSGMGNIGISLTGLYEFGSELIFIAIPELGYVFDYWKNGDTVLSGTDLGDGTNQLTIVVDQILDIIAFFKPAENTPYTVEHYKQNLDQTGYEFAGSETMYGTTDGQTSVTGTDYEGFSLSGDLASYQTGIKADGSTVVKLYYDRNVYTITWNNWNGSEITTTPAVYGNHPEFARDGWPQRYRADDEVEYLFIFTGWSRSGSSEIIRELTGLTTEIVTGDTTYIAQYDQIYRFFEVRYHPNGGTGNMGNQVLQLNTSGTLVPNLFTRTGYEFSGWLYSNVEEGIHNFYEDGQEVNLGRMDGVDGDREGETLLYIDLYAQWKPSTGTKFKVNCYAWNLDSSHNHLIGTTHLTGIEHVGTTNSSISINDYLWPDCLGIDGYNEGHELSGAIVYGSDLSGGVETGWLGTTTVLADGTRRIDMYIVPKQNNYFVTLTDNCGSKGSLDGTYYYGAKINLEASPYECYSFSGWIGDNLPNTFDKTSAIAEFDMPNNYVIVTPTVRENTYDIIFSGNGSTSGTMLGLSVLCTSGVLSQNAFEREGYTFAGWSTTSTGIVEFGDESEVYRLNTEDDGSVTLYAVWNINDYEVTGSVAEGQENMGYLSGNTLTGISLTGLYDYGTELIFIAVPELGYLFDYWEVNGWTGENLPEGATASGNQLTVIVDQILDIVAHFTENIKTVTINYYEMNTGGVYSGVTNSTTFTGLVGQTGYATVNIPYGFHLDTTKTTNTGIVISDNDLENVISIYYARNQHQLNKFYTGDFQYNYNLVHFEPVLKQYYYYGEHLYIKVIADSGYTVDNLTCSGGDNINIYGTGIEFDMGDGDVTIIIDGSKNRYRIDYYLDGGIENPAEPNVTGYTITDGSIQIHDPIKTGYNFLGWTGGMSGDWISNPTSGLIIYVSNGLGDRQYYANWEKNLYIVNVIIDPENGGTVGGTGEYYYGDRVSLIEAPNVDSGYQFTGWYTYEGYNKISDDYQIGFQADDSGGTGLIAKFELRNHYLEVIPNDWTKGSYYPEYRNYYQYGTIVPVYANPNPGYQIRGWKWDPSEDYITTGEDNHIYTGLNIDVNITWDTSIYVDFEPETYNITYMYSGEILSGDIFSPSTYTVEQNICGEYIPDGSCMYYLPIYSKDGYDFTGWYYDERIFSYSKVGLLTGIGDITLYAGLIPTTYRVYYHLGSGETLPGWYIDNYDEYTIESGRTYLPEPEKQGYDFLGWKDNNNQIITGFGGGMTGDLDLYPIWTGKVMNIEVRYHEMDTNGQYPREWSSIYYTGVIDSTFNIPDYTSTGFSQDQVNYPYQPSSIIVSGNDYANMVDVYYKRETYWLNTLGIKRLLPEIDSGVTFAEVIPDKQESGNQYYFGEEITVNLLFNDGWNFTGRYDATDEDMGFPPEEVSDLTVRNFSFHMPAHNVKIEPLMEHIPYILSFTGYEGADISEYYPGIENQEIYFGYHAYLPYLSKSGYWFNGWKDEYGNYEWRTGEPYPSEPTLQRMPSHDYELIADFSPRTDMGYAEYYYLQDIEGSGYSLSGDLTTWWLDGVTEQLIPKRYPTVTGFELPWYWIDGQDLPYDSLGPVINATGENFINYYYDRLTYLVDVDYDSSKMSIIGTGEYRYDAPVTLTATVNSGYEFSGFVSENPEYNTTGSTLSFRVPYDFVISYPPIIHAYAEPIEYSIDYELNGGESYYSYPTGYTVEDESIYLSDPYKNGYDFLGWTGGVIGVWELTEPTTGLIIPSGSIGNRKYYANFEVAGSNVTVNYYLKKIDPENNVLTGEVDEYLMGVVYTGLTDSVVDIHALYGTGIEGYEYTTAIVYGSDSIGGLETGTTTILGDGSRSIDIYYTPKKYDFTVIQGQNSTISGTSMSTGYYFGAYVTLSGGSVDSCFEWDKWGSQTLPEGKNQQHTIFEMPSHNITVESMVKEKSYNIIFNANGGTGTMSTLSVQCTSGTLSANNFERDGYTFTGWSRNTEGPVEFIGETDIHRLSTESGGEVTLFAIWDVNWYTVTFDLNGGSLAGDMTDTIDYTIETPAISLENYIPIKTGYNFSGWFKDNDLANSIAGGKTGNYTLTAKWEAIPFTVSFDSALGTVVENQIYYYNDVLSGLDNAITTKTGYNFSGWYLGDVLYTAVSRMPAKNITLTAKWTPRTGIQYQVNHRGENTGNNNYTTLLSSYKMYGTSDSQTVAESGNFAGFSLSGNVNQKIIEPDGTTVVDIYYNRNVYSIILDNNGGTGVIELTGKYQAPLIVPNPSKSGYEFAGWNPELPMTIPSYNYTGIAMWNPSTGEYKVEFYYQLSDGIYPSMATSGVIRTGMTEGTGNVTAADKTPTMSGYSFDSTNTGNVLEGEIVGDGSLVLKVYFKKQFTVRYLTGLYGTFSVDVHSNLDYGVGTPIFRGSTGSHESGYTFLGWNPELTGIVVEDRDYIAQWKADSDTEFKVEYYLQNVEDDGYTFAETGLQTGTTNTTGYADTMKEFTGFIFSGGNQNNITSGVIVGDGSLVLKLYYDRKEYNVTIGEVEHGTMEGGTGSQRYGKRITFTAHPNAGYMISKWLRDGTEILSGWVIWTGEELEIEVDTGMEIGVEFKAREDTPYYVEYYKENLEGGYNVWTGTYSGTTDQEAIASELIFTGFTYDSGNVDNVTTGNIDGDGSRVLVMYYTRNINNVVYVYTGKIPTGQVVPVASGYKYESNVTVAEAPSVSGYNFNWSTGVSSFIMPDEEVTITGTWTANTGTKYAVKHMLQNVEDDEYTQTGENQILSGETNELTDAQANNYTGFVAQAVTQTGIRGDESTVVEIYYDREIYGVTTGETEHGSVNGETGNQRYGKVITFTAHPEIGYILDKWFKNGEEIISGGVIWTGEELEIEVDTGMEISAEFKAREDTPYYVEYYKENLEGGYDVWTGIQYGTSDTEGVAEELIFTGFTYDPGNVNNITTGNIDGDGSKVLKMYYNREIYTITWLNEDGTDMDTTTVKYGEIPTHADPTQPADAHYTYKFKGWDPEPTFATGEISYRATYEYIVNKHTITWKNDDGSLIDKTMVEYGTIPTHTKPTKAETEDYRYVFAGWDPEVVAVVGDAEYTAVFNAEEKEKSSKGGGMSGGGGRGGNIDNFDNQHGSAQENIDGSGYTGDEVVEVDDTNKDIVPLYKWTYENNVTTMDTLEDADPDGLLTRGHLAKMVVNYMVNVLGRSMPYDITYNCLYWGDDESSWESDEIKDYATKACAFGVMGINMENNEFLPNNIVTRAEFGTVMSRILWGDKYDITDTNHRSYFEDHLQALKRDNILTQIANPETRWEIRKWVWLVFRRILEKLKNSNI